MLGEREREIRLPDRLADLFRDDCPERRERGFTKRPRRFTKRRRARSFVDEGRRNARQAERVDERLTADRFK